MSKHIVGMFAEGTAVELAEAGSEVGEDTVEAGHVAILFGTASDIAAIEGTLTDVRALLQKALDTLPSEEVAEPELVPGKPGDEAVCQHVWTVEEVADRGAYRAAYLAHNPDTDIDRWVPAFVVGEQCGADLSYAESVIEYRPVREWKEAYVEEDGAVHPTVSVSDSDHTDGGDEPSRMFCSEGHYWAVPDIEYF